MAGIGFWVMIWSLVSCGPASGSHEYDIAEYQSNTIMQRFDDKALLYGLTPGEREELRIQIREDLIVILQQK
jgi:hypothetical protein